MTKYAHVYLYECNGPNCEKEITTEYDWHPTGWIEKYFTYQRDHHFCSAKCLKEFEEE